MQDRLVGPARRETHDQLSSIAILELHAWLHASRTRKANFDPKECKKRSVAFLKLRNGHKIRKNEDLNLELRLEGGRTEPISLDSANGSSTVRGWRIGLKVTYRTSCV